MSGDGANRRSVPWLALALLFVGLFGATVAVSGLWAPLPTPKAGGTCGPGLGSEAAIQALVEPGSIGAGPEPPATNRAGRAQWTQFVDECQTATDHRALVTIPVLVVSLVLAVSGLVLLWKRAAWPEHREPSAVQHRPPVPDRPPGPPPPYAVPYPAAAGPPGPPPASAGL